MDTTSAPIVTLSMIMPFYCNPFFSRCKHFFCKIQTFFRRPQKKLPYFTCDSPETGKNALQPGPKGPFPEHPSGQHPEQIPDPKVSGTDSKAKADPGPKKGQDKEAVRQSCFSWPQRP